MINLLKIFCISIVSSYGIAQCKADAGPNYSITQSKDSKITLGGKPSATGGSSNYSYQWSPSTGLSCSNCANPIVTLSELTSNTTFVLTITDNSTKCISKDEVIVSFDMKDKSSNSINNRQLVPIEVEEISMDQDGDESFGEVVLPAEVEEVITAESICSFPEQEAEYPGGKVALTEFIKQNLHYPETALESEIEGKTYVGMVINLDGSISDVKILRGVPGCPECDKEAIRIVKIMPKFTPAQVNGKDVRSRYTLPVVFKIN